MKSILFLTIIPFMALGLIAGTGCKNKKSIVITEKDDHISKILYYASMAGSSHNSQPWKVEVINNDSILVYADTLRLLKVVDPKGIELVVSIGAFIENLNIAANSLGYNTEITINETDIYSKIPLAKIKLSKNNLPLQPQKLLDLEHRTTLRIPFDTLPIKENDWKRLLANDTSRIEYIHANSVKGHFIAKNELKAYTIQAYQKEAQKELTSWIRFSNKDVNTKRDGLTPAGMGIKGIAGLVVRNFLKPEDSEKESFVKSGVEKTQKQVLNCGGWLIIYAEKDSISDWIQVGRIYERLNIESRSLNIGFHPMNQIIEVPEIEQLLNNKLSSSKKVRFVARIGYVKNYPLPVSKRRPVNSFTTYK